MRTGLLRAQLIVASAALAVTALAAPAGAGVSGPKSQTVLGRFGAAQRDVSSASLPTDNLTGVSATSTARAWAVGYAISGTAKALILRWNSRTKIWSQVKRIPNPSTTDNKLYAVTAVSASNAWATGYYRNDATADDQALILHWNGTAWSRVKTIKNLPTAGSNLTAVTATSASSAWAVGFAVNQALILHWNGTGWSRVGVKNLPSSANYLSGVTATSASNAWAAGYYYTGPSSNIPKALILHWNGTRWSRVGLKNLPSTASQLSGVTATSASNAWAAGYYVTSTSTTKTLILHWNGTVWSRFSKPTPPSPGRLTNVLSGIRAASASNAWAVGQYTDNTTSLDDALILDWNGAAWSRVGVKNLPSASNDFMAVGAWSASSAWAVGFSCTNVACTTSNTLIAGWNGTIWKRYNSPSPGASGNILARRRG